MYKRYISILLCCAICAGLLILPVNAASLDSDSISQAGTEYINYFIADEYLYLTDYWYDTDYPSYDFSSVNRFAFKWTPDTLTVGSFMLFAIQASNKPSAVSVRFTSTGSYTSATYEGAIPSTPNLYFYRVNMPSTFTGVEIFGRYDNPYTGNISIASCFGVRNMLSVYDRAEFIYVPILKKTEGEFAEGTYNSGTQFFPYDAPSWLSSSSHFDRIDFVIRADGKRFNTSAVGRVSLLITTFCDNLTATVSLVAKNTDVRDINNIKCNISTDSSWGLVNQYAVGLGTMYNQSAYQLSFDLTGYDMTNYDLQIFLSVDTVSYASEGAIGTKLFDLHFRSMTYVPVLLSNPWYKPITDSISGVVFWFKNINVQIEDLLNDLLDWWSELFTRWDTTFEGIMNKLEIMLGVSSDQQTEVESNVQQNTEKQEEVTDKSDQLISDLEEIEEQEEEMLTVPEIDQADLALGTLIPQSGLTLMNNVMVTITNNDHVSQMIVLVLSIAVVGVLIL